jgi:hypothetical protein
MLAEADGLGKKYDVPVPQSVQEGKRTAMLGSRVLDPKHPYNIGTPSFVYNCR